jgi:hypothetical protein
MSQVTRPIRPSVVLFSAISPTLKAALVLLVLLPHFLPLPRPNLSLLARLLAGVIAWSLVRAALAQRLSSLEKAVVQYWSFTPMIILIIAGALAAIPILVVDHLADRFSWSSVTVRNLVLAAQIVSLVWGAVVVWGLWVRFRTSLGGDMGGSQRAAYQGAVADRAAPYRNVVESCKAGSGGVAEGCRGRQLSADPLGGASDDSRPRQSRRADCSSRNHRDARLSRGPDPSEH